jgi:hypothetical protein
MPPAGFETAIPACERAQTHALDCPATGTGIWSRYKDRIIKIVLKYLGCKILASVDSILSSERLQ